MQNKSLMHPVYSSRRIISISIGILSTLLLASCGGGGLSDPNATAQSADDATKTIQAVSGSTAVPGTWTGRAPKMEVINGITVPPEPAPTINNATLAGVDVNNNGVRDDVERVIAKQASDENQFAASIMVAGIYGAMLSKYNKSDQISRAQAVSFYSDISCAAKRFPTIGADRNLVRILMANTEARREIFRKLDTALDGGVLGSELKICQ